MVYSLSDGLSFCAHGGVVVLLDEKRDRYFQLGGSLGRALLALVEGAPTSDDALSRLVKLGVLAETPAYGRPVEPCNAQVPSESVLDGRPLPPASWALRAEVATLLARSYARIRFRPFDELLQDLRQRRSVRARSIAPSTDLLISTALLFERARRTVPVRPLCLPDSLALLAFLDRRDIRAELVLAVRANPFSAHCWVQTDGLILNEAADHAAMHTPIQIA